LTELLKSSINKRVVVVAHQASAEAAVVDTQEVVEEEEEVAVEVTALEEAEALQEVS
jgi:hypothetical protein